VKSDSGSGDLPIEVTTFPEIFVLSTGRWKSGFLLVNVNFTFLLWTEFVFMVFTS
jgi:hypothetical protein